MVNTSWKEEYPFTDNYLIMGEHKLHYVDEGAGHPVIMLHGNPTWSFFYRDIINDLKSDYRCIVPDHLGCGLSDKPQDYDYTLENHINNVIKLIEKLELKKFSLIVHDWGGAIGMGVATAMPDKVTSMTIMNTAAFKSKSIPFSISLCKIPYIGEKLVRHFNAFAWPATYMAVVNKLPERVRNGYLHPYNNYENRIATARFVKDIPLIKWHPSYKKLDQIENNLTNVTCPKLFLWGAKDFCFTLKFLKRWKDFFPTGKTVVLENAGHYLLEDEKQRCVSEISRFVHEHCPAN